MADILINDSCLAVVVFSNHFTFNFFLFSPGVTITELQKRGGLSDEAYAAVSKIRIEKLNSRNSISLAPPLCFS